VARLVVSLVTHNESRDLEVLLPTLSAQTYRDFEVVAVDNASEEGTRGVLAAWQKRGNFLFAYSTRGRTWASPEDTTRESERP